MQPGRLPPPVNAADRNFKTPIIGPRCTENQLLVAPQRSASGSAISSPSLRSPPPKDQTMVAFSEVNRRLSMSLGRITEGGASFSGEPLGVLYRAPRGRSLAPILGDGAFEQPQSPRAPSADRTPTPGERRRQGYTRSTSESAISETVLSKLVSLPAARPFLSQVTANPPRPPQTRSPGHLTPRGSSPRTTPHVNTSPVVYIRRGDSASPASMDRSSPSLGYLEPPRSREHLLSATWDGTTPRSPESDADSECEAACTLPAPGRKRSASSHSLATSPLVRRPRRSESAIAFPPQRAGRTFSFPACVPSRHLFEPVAADDVKGPSNPIREEKDPKPPEDAASTFDEEATRTLDRYAEDVVSWLVAEVLLTEQPNRSVG